jgi:hypothetical protein
MFSTYLRNKIFLCPRDAFCLGLASFRKKDFQLGQSTVEYILLLAVVISLIFVVINSDRFKDLLGDGGGLAQRVKQELEWNYRFGSQFYGDQGAWNTNLTGSSHPAYWNQRRSNSHFIGPLRPYPR